MSVKTNHGTEYTFWFITFTCFDWKDLIATTNAYDMVYKWFKYMKEKQLADVIAYVIMPNHFHAILSVSQQQKSIDTIVANGKRFIAYEIVKRLKTKGEYDMLAQLSTTLTDRDRKKGQKHKVFIESFDGKPIFTEKFLLQKVSYIHKNPVSGKWMLVNDYAKYEHSSASYYEFGIVKHFEPKDFRDV